MKPFSVSPLVTVSRDWGVWRQNIYGHLLAPADSQGTGARGQGQGSAVKAFHCFLKYYREYSIKISALFRSLVYLIMLFYGK